MTVADDYKRGYDAACKDLWAELDAFLTADKDKTGARYSAAVAELRAALEALRADLDRFDAAVTGYDDARLGLLRLMARAVQIATRRFPHTPTGE